MVLAVTLGIMSGNGSPMQLIHAGGRHRGNDNAAMVVGPAVLVAFFLIAHAIVFTQLRANFSEDNRKADFDGRLQSGALRPSAPTGERSSGTGRREQRRRIRSRQLRISLLAG